MLKIEKIDDFNSACDEIDEVIEESVEKIKLEKTGLALITIIILSIMGEWKN